MGYINKYMQNKLKYLSTLPESKYPFITIYLNVNAHEFFNQARQNKIFIKNEFKKVEKKLLQSKNRSLLYSFEKDVEKINYYLANEVNTKTHGLAIFACEGLGVWEVFQTIFPFENNVHVNTIPHLKQLTYQADESETTLVIMTDNHTSRIFIVKLGGYIIHESDMKHELHGFHKQGGWAQLRYQRHIGNQVLKHFKEVSKLATELIDNNNIENIYLVGQHNELVNLQKYFPKRVNLKIKEYDKADIRANTREILEKITDDINQTELKKEINYVNNVLESVPVNSVTGLQDTIKITEEGRAKLLVVQSNKSAKGWKCNGCLYTSRDQYQAGCEKCNGNTRETDLIEELIRLSIKNNGEIEIVKDHAAEKLNNYEGIGAIVRY